MPIMIVMNAASIIEGDIATTKSDGPTTSAMQRMGSRDRPGDYTTTHGAAGYISRGACRVGPSCHDLGDLIFDGLLGRHIAVPSLDRLD